MARDFAESSGFQSFFRKLSVALPANLFVFLLVLQGDLPVALLYGGVGAMLGALMLVTWERRVSFAAPQKAPVVQMPTRSTVRRDLPSYPRPA